MQLQGNPSEEPGNSKDEWKMHRDEVRIRVVIRDRGLVAVERLLVRRNMLKMCGRCTILLCGLKIETSV